MAQQEWYHKALPLSSQITLGLAPDPRQDALAKAFEFKRAALAYASHHSSCKKCNDDDCETGSKLWMDEFGAENALFDALHAAQPYMQATGGHAAESDNSSEHRAASA